MTFQVTFFTKVNGWHEFLFDDGKKYYYGVIRIEIVIWNNDEPDNIKEAEKFIIESFKHE